MYTHVPDALFLNVIAILHARGYVFLSLVSIDSREFPFKHDVRYARDTRIFFTIYGPGCSIMLSFLEIMDRDGIVRQSWRVHMNAQFDTLSSLPYVDEESVPDYTWAPIIPLFRRTHVFYSPRDNSFVWGFVEESTNQERKRENEWAVITSLADSIDKLRLSLKKNPYRKFSMSGWEPEAFLGCRYTFWSRFWRSLDQVTPEELRV